MKTLKNTLTTLALLIAVQFSYAQSSAMKAPVSYKLKNGMTIIIAENPATQKVFSTLSFEGPDQYRADKAAVQELINTILTQQLPEVNQGLSFTDKGINLVTTADEFEAAISAMSVYVSAPEFTEQALTQAKLALIAHIHAQDKYYPSDVNAAAIKNLTVDDVKAYYARIADPATAYLTVAGNVKPSTLKAYAKKALVQLKASKDRSQIYLVAML